ncbi:hypothetical protein OIO90_004351 [Microbotryomycetes sp. JL221]|nr:hypothetical protein OIO90_004351 [Microbotryomycetes sp. JL221]
MVLQNKHKQIASSRYKRRHANNDDSTAAPTDELDVPQVYVGEQPSRYDEEEQMTKPQQTKQGQSTTTRQSKPDSNVASTSSSNYKSIEQRTESETVDQQLGSENVEELDEENEDEFDRQEIESIVRKHELNRTASMFEGNEKHVEEDVDHDFSFMRMRQANPSVPPLSEGRRTGELNVGTSKTATERRLLAARNTTKHQVGARQIPQSRPTNFMKDDEWLDQLLG